MRSNLSLCGGVVIEDAATVSNLVTTSSVGFSGNVTVTNSGTIQGTAFAVSAWREF